MAATAARGLDGLDWDSAPVFGEGEDSTDQKDRVERVQAELATLPERPPAKPTDQLIGYKKACDILGVTRGAIQQWVKKGTLTDRGRDPTGRINLLSLEEVQAFAAERSSRHLERGLTTPEREQARMERHLAPLLGGSVPQVPQAVRKRDDERHVELIDAVQELRVAIETSAREQLQATRELMREQRETNEQLSTLNTALLITSLGAAGAALLPDHFLQEIKAKVGGVVGRLIRPEAEPVESLVTENGAGGLQLTEGGSRMILAELQRKAEEEKNRTK